MLVAVILSGFLVGLVFSDMDSRSSPQDLATDKTENACPDDSDQGCAV